MYRLSPLTVPERASFSILLLTVGWTEEQDCVGMTFLLAIAQQVQCRYRHTAQGVWSELLRGEE